MPTPLQQEFIRRLKEVIRTRGLRQTDVARELAVTSSAVSQIMHGKIRLAPERFREAAEKLAFPPLEIYELTRMLSCIKAGTEEFYSLWNQRIFSCRNARGLSRARLSILTGIPVERLCELEENNAAQPTPDEFLRLRETFSRREVLPEAAESVSANFLNPLFSREAFPQSELPLLTLYDCGEYRPGTDLALFAAEHTRRRCCHAVHPDARNPVAVSASGSELGFAYPGTLLLIVAEEKPAGFAPLLLCCTGNGRFVLRTLAANDDDFSPYLLEMPPEKTPPSRWELPVLELCFAPVDVRSFDHGLF